MDDTKNSKTTKESIQKIRQLNINLSILMNSMIKLHFSFKFNEISNLPKLKYKIFKILTDLGISKLDFLNIKLKFKNLNSLQEEEIITEDQYKNFIVNLFEYSFKMKRDLQIELNDLAKQKFKLKCILSGELYLEENKAVEKSLNNYLDIYDSLIKKSNEIEDEIISDNIVNDIYICNSYNDLIKYYEKVFIDLMKSKAKEEDYSCYFDDIKNLLEDNYKMMIIRQKVLKEKQYYHKESDKENNNKFKLKWREDYMKNLQCQELEVDPRIKGFYEYFTQKKIILSQKFKNTFEELEL